MSISTAATTFRIPSGNAIVIGASGGIGSSVATTLASHGITSVLIGRDEHKLIELAGACEDLGTKAFPLQCDISQICNIEATVQKAVNLLGGLNYLINCAGVSAKAALYETDLSGAELVINTNLRAHLHFARYALPHINKSSAGAVIKIGAVHHPYSGVNTYLAANQGAEGLAQAMFEDVREFGTKVCTIKPGWVNTPLVQTVDLDSSLMIQPEDVARTILYILATPETTCPTEITLLPQRSPQI